MSKTKEEIVKQVRDKDGSKVKVKFKVTPRQGIVAPPGMVVAGFDYEAEEAILAAVFSGDPKMLDIFHQPTKIEGPDGKMYPNPDADIHTINAVNCCFPELFVDEHGNPKPKWQIVKIAKDDNLITQKGNPRFYGKMLGLGVMYNQGAESISGLHHVKEAIAEKWLDLHKKTFPVFHGWRKEVANIADARGWMETPWLKRIRGVVESNAKNSGESPGVLGVNFAIQGSGSDLLKYACSMVRLHREQFANGSATSRVKFIVSAHDESVFLIPGRCRLDLEASSWKGDVITEPVWIPTDEVLELAMPIKQKLEDAETLMLDGVIKGRVGCSISPYWSK